MSKKQQSFNIIKEQGMLPLYFHPSAEVSLEVLRTLYKCGIRAVEYTNRGAEALDNFKQMLALRNAELPGLELGIGTIKTAEDAKAYIDAGADYIISPAIIPVVAGEVNKTDLMYVPGCMTPSEIVTAQQYGCSFIKLFPGNLLGPSFMSAIKDLFPDINFMPTGGVEVEEKNVSDWFASGVVAVGMGSKMISKSLMDKKDYATIEQLTIKALDIIKTVRNK